MTVTDALLEPLLSGDPARPAITFYDDRSGERIELSGLTLANWVAKTANLLRDECDVEAGSTVAVALPGHWQTAAALLGAWWCGARVIDGADVESDPAAADVALADAGHLDAVAGAGLVVGFSLDAFGAPLPGLPGGALDYASEVRLHGDHFTADPLSDDAPALGDATVAEVVGAARRRAETRGLGSSDRVLGVDDWPLHLGDGGVADRLLAVLAAGAGLVQVRHPDPARLDHKAETEKVTARL